MQTPDTNRTNSQQTNHAACASLQPLPYHMALKPIISTPETSSP
jgi:hypothetical protein